MLFDVIHGPSRHLSWHELACHDEARTPYPFEWRADRAAVLGMTFEVVRTLLGDVPLVVLSGYRTEAYNSHLEGAASKSQHVQGRAVDLCHPRLAPLEMFRTIRAAHRLGTLPLLGGLGLYKTFVHIDVRPKTNGHLALWAGAGVTLPPDVTL